MKPLKTLLPVLLLCALSAAVDAQLKTYLNLETGPQWSILRVSDPGNYLTGANVTSTVAGITLSQEILANLSVTSGVYYIPYKAGIRMDDDRRFQSSWNSHTSLLIPLRAEYRINFPGLPVSLSPRIGYIYHRASMPAGGHSAGSVLSAPDGTAFSYSYQQTTESPGRHLIEGGFSLGLPLHGNWMASLNLSYLSGLGASASSLLEYTDQDMNTREAEYRSKGNAIHTTLAFNVPVSNLWQNRDYRIRSRIEQSTGKGKPVDRQGEFYAGTEAGSLWRIFAAGNPAVGPRPMEGRGVFRYADMHAGIYAGYMLNNELGIDLGIMYQRSSVFYALMYDHAVNFVTREPAPMFLEVPLRLRYFYNLYKKKLYYAVYGGVSLLTHFSGTDYRTGGGDFTYLSPESGNPVPATTTYTASRTARFRPLLRVGTGIEYKLPVEFPLFATLYAGYSHGFISIDNLGVSTSLPESPSVSNITYRGSGWSIDAGLKIPFRFGKEGVCGTRPEKEDMQ